MADNSTLPATGDVIAADDIGGVKFQRTKQTWGPDGTANDVDTASGKPLPVQLRVSDGTAHTYGAGAVAAGTQRVTHASDDPVTTSVQLIDDVIFTDDAAFTPGTSKVAVIGAQADETATDSVDEGDAGALRMTLDRRLIVAPLGYLVTCSTDITRPNDTTAYAANDAWSDSTSAPTSGGFTFTSAARKSGGSGIITDAIITSSADPGTLLQGEIWLFDTSVTNINDNSAFAVSDAEIKTMVGKIPFTMEDAGNNDSAHVQNLGIGFTCVGSANLRYLVKVKNAYTPAAQEVLTVRLKIIQVD